MSFIDILEPGTGKLLFRHDPQRGIIEVQRRGVKTLVDLTQYEVERQGAPGHEPDQNYETNGRRT